MFQDTTTSSGFQLLLQACVQKQEVTRLLQRKVSHTERKTQAHLKPYSPKAKKSADEHCLSQSSNMQMVKFNHKKFNKANNQVQSYSRPMRDIKLQVKLDLQRNM